MTSSMRWLAVKNMGKRLSKSTAKGNKGEQFVRSWATEMECVNFCPDTTAPSIDGMIQLYDEHSDTNFYIFFQAKCGNSHLRKTKPDAKHILLKLDSEDIANWQRAGYPVIIIWVSDDPPCKRYALWSDARRGLRGADQIKISKRSLLDSRAFPALLDVAKAYAGFHSFPKLSGSPLFPTKVSTVKTSARQFYSEWRSVASVSPIFGKTEITLKAWRHITRASSPQRNVCHKLSLLPFAREILEKCTKSRFLRLLHEDKKLVRRRHTTNENPPLTYSFPAEERKRHELHALCGIYRSSYRTDLIIEVIVEVLRVNNHIVKTRLYGVHERIK